MHETDNFVEIPIENSHKKVVLLPALQGRHMLLALLGFHEDQVLEIYNVLGLILSSCRCRNQCC